MVFKPLIFLILLFLIRKMEGYDLEENEQRMLNKNVKILRRDFNKLIENVEDFAEDFLKQIQEAGTLVGTAYISDRDYNWQDDKPNTIKQTQENDLNSIANSIKQTEAKTAKPKPKAQFSKFYSLPEKNLEEQELTNEIQTRKKRSVQENTINNNFNGRQPLLNPQVQNVPSPTAPIRSNIEQRLPNQPLPAGEPKREPGNVLGSQQNTNNKSDFKDQTVCTSKTQKEIDMEQQKLQELKMEVTKLNDLISLLKDQQKLIKSIDEENKGLESNEIDDGDLQKDSFLYKALKQLREKRKKNEQNENFEHITDKSGNLAGLEMDELKRNLKKTVANLDETKEMFIKEKEKEDILESELKRQNSELKFLKVMMESLYDKSNAGLHKQRKTSTSDVDVRNSDLKDIDIDSVLGATHTPKPWPLINHSVREINSNSQNMEPANGISQGNSNKFRRNATVTAQLPEPSIEEKFKKFFKLIHKYYGGKLANADIEFNKAFERDFFANMTKSALIEMTKHDPDRFKKFKIDTRESNPAKSQQNNVRRLLSILSKQKSEDAKNQLITADERHSNEPQINHLNDQNKENETILAESRARASGNSKTDDLAFKLKLMDILTNEGKSDDTDDKEKRLNEMIKKLIRPEKKSDDELTLDALKALVKDQQRPQKTTQISLSNLFKSLNEKPQGKTDDANIENQLMQLQKAINNLRPKEDTGFNNFDLLDNRRGKDDAQDFQSMLNQIIAQNGANTNKDFAAQTSFNVAGTGSHLDKNAFVTKQLLNQIIHQDKAYDTGLSGQVTGIQDFINGYRAPQYAAGPIAQPYGLNAYPYGPNGNLYSPSSNYGQSYNPNYGNSYNPILNPYSSNGYAGGYNANQPIGYGSPQRYKGGTTYLEPYSESSYQPAIHYPPPKPYFSPYDSTNSYVPSPYNSNYQPPKTSYPSPNYGYQNSGLTAPSYTSGSPNNYGNKPIQESPADYGKSFFLSPSAAGGSYQRYNHGAKSYARPSLDQSYGNSQGFDQHKNGIISDLTQQIQNLENIITGLNRGSDYSHMGDDKAAIAGLEQRIYELKGVISSLNQPYGVQQQTYQTNIPSYRQIQFSTPTYNQSPAPQNQAQPSYGNIVPLVYNDKAQPGGSDGRKYNENQPVQTFASQQPESPINIPSAPSASTTYQESQPNYNPNPSSASPQSSYQSNSQETPYQPYSGQSSASYQLKESIGEDRRMSPVERKMMEVNKHEVKTERQRKKRQIGREIAPPRAIRPEGDADMIIKLTQPDTPEQSPSYALGDDALAQIANTFKKYLVENLTQSQSEYQTQESQPYTNNQNRNSALDGLQRKLENLKTELESQKPSARSFNDLLGPPAYSLAPTSSSYGSQNTYIPSLYNTNVYQQDEPYGYLGYQSSSYHNNYPQYEPDHYDNHYKSVTNSNYGNRERAYASNYRSNMEPPIDGNFYGRPIVYNNYDIPTFDAAYTGFTDGNYGNNPLQYSRGYFDYFKGNREKNMKKK